MKVIFLTKNYKPELGGTYTAIKGIFDELSKKIDVKVYDKSTNIFSLIKIIKESDICHFFGGWDFFHLFFTNLAFLMNKYVIIHPLGFYSRWGLDNKKLKKYVAMLCYQKRILQKADLIHCSSEMEKKDILKIDKTLNTQVIPFGLANNFYNKKKKILKIKHRALFFSRIEKKKNLHNLINEWIKIDNKKWSLDICGPCEDTAYYEYLRSLTKNSNSINFLSPVYTDVAKINLFKKYDFMILPTKNDTFALAILECLANGLPVLTNHNVPWASIKKMNAGWYIPYNNSILRHTLKKIFKLKPKDFFIKSENSYALAQKFNWNIVRTDYISTYTKLLETNNSIEFNL
jgi:glycosyltransferase involved in cell wall biosynthesis